MAASDKENLSVRLARWVAEFLLPSLERDFNAVLRRPIRLLIVGLIGLIVALCLPPMVDFLVASFPGFFLFQSFADYWPSWGRWLGFVSLLAELLFALFVGGSVFGQWISSVSQDVLDAAQERFELATHHNVEAAGAELVDSVATVEQLVRDASLASIFKDIARINKAVNRVFGLLYDGIPRRTATFIVAKVMVAFPGGLYGVLAFAIFWVLAFTKLLAVYHEALMP